jgi:putative NIF3 family GTP cyclohydrolase 1 type 2
MILDLAESGIACISAHTNLDVARDGVSFALAEVLRLENITFLDSLDSNLLLAVCICPANLETQARNLALELSSNPKSIHQIQTTGTHNAITEFEISQWTRNAVAGRLEREMGAEASVRFSELSSKNQAFGLGAIGTLTKTQKLRLFLEDACIQLNVPTLRFSGDPDSDVKHIAVCGGSGSSLLGKARAAKADVLLTADVSYHSYFDVLDANGHPEMALVDVGHYESEAVTEKILVDYISSTFPSLSCRRTRIKTSPMQHFVL